jgi:chromosome segregation ATPase
VSTVPEASNLDLLEEKIARAITRIAALKDENQALMQEKEALQSRLRESEESKGALESRLQGLESKLAQAEHSGADLDVLSRRVDGILSKFEVLDL